MPMWECDIRNCPRPAVRTLGDCVLCDRHLCSRHLQVDFHSCPKWEHPDAYDPAAREAEQQEMTRLLQKINIRALTARASELRQGVPCSLPPLQYDRDKRSSVMGGMNYHLDIKFEDGTVWLARIRRFNATSPPPALRDYIIQSEVASLKFLERTAVPAPRVFDFALEGGNNPVGIGYILTEKLPGSSLRWSMLSSSQKKKVMEQLSDIFVELQRYSFDQMGCLDTPGSRHIGAFARESLTDFDGSRMLTLGPFSSLQEYHVASLRLILDLILRDELYTERSVDAYLIHRFLLDLVPSVLPRTAREAEKFFLKHADDKGDHIMVDEAYNITGIIDWEWAYTAPKALAFNSPVGLLPVSDFYNGANSLGEEELIFAQLLEGKGHPDLAEVVRQGRLQHRFAFCCGYDLADWSGFLGLFQGLRDAVGVDGGLDWDDWRKVAMERYSSDDGLQLLLSKV